jgi:hypothetical protein
MSPTKVPETIRLGDVYDVIRCPDMRHHDLPIIAASMVDVDAVQFPATTTPAVNPPSAEYKAAAGDTVLKLANPFGAAYMPAPPSGVYYGLQVAGLRPKTDAPTLPGPLLAAYLNTRAVRHWFQTGEIGHVILRISSEHLRKLPLPILGADQLRKLSAWYPSAVKLLALQEKRVETMRELFASMLNEELIKGVSTVEYARAFGRIA